MSHDFTPETERRRLMYLVSNYRLQTKLHEGNVFTPVYHSVHRGEGATPLDAPAPLDVYHPWRKYAPLGQPAGGTHPTGMHSCFICNQLKIRTKIKFFLLFLLMYKM